MRKRVFTLLLCASPVKAKAEPMKLAMGPARRALVGATLSRAPAAAHIMTSPQREEAPARPVDHATVMRVLAARVSPEETRRPANDERVLELPPTMFDLEPKRDKPQRRRISVAPASFMAGGSGIKVKIPI